MTLYTTPNKPGTFKKKLVSLTQNLEVRTLPDGTVLYGKPDTGQETKQLLTLRKLGVRVPAFVAFYSQLKTLSKHTFLW